MIILLMNVQIFFPDDLERESDGARSASLQDFGR